MGLLLLLRRWREAGEAAASGGKRAVKGSPSFATPEGGAQPG